MSSPAGDLEFGAQRSAAKIDTNNILKGEEWVGALIKNSSINHGARCAFPHRNVPGLFTFFSVTLAKQKPAFGTTHSTPRWVFLFSVSGKSKLMYSCTSVFFKISTSKLFAVRFLRYTICWQVLICIVFLVLNEFTCLKPLIYRFKY